MITPCIKNSKEHNLPKHYSFHKACKCLYVCVCVLPEQTENECRGDESDEGETVAQSVQSLHHRVEQQHVGFVVAGPADSAEAGVD